MSLLKLVNRHARSFGPFYVLAAVIFWISAIPLLLFPSLRWVAALHFVAGLIFLLLWQILSGEKSTPC